MGASLLDHAHTLTTHIGPTCDAKAPPLHLQNLSINDGLLGLGPLAKPLQILQCFVCCQPGACGPFNPFQHCIAILLAIAQGSAEVMQCLLLLLQDPMICLAMAQRLAMLSKGAKFHATSNTYSTNALGTQAKPGPVSWQHCQALALPWGWHCHCQWLRAPGMMQSLTTHVICSPPMHPTCLITLAGNT